MIQQKKDTNAKAQKTNQGSKRETPNGSQRIQVEKPTLPFSFERMLRRQGEDKDLKTIQVSFFARGMQEIKFVVEDEDGFETTMTAGEYQSHRHKVKPKIEAAKHDDAAKGFFKKLETRCWIKSDNDSEIHAKAVKALKWPSFATTAFGFSQADIKAKKLTPTRLFAIWNELKTKSPEGFKEMCDFQQRVDPNYNWDHTIKSYSLFAERAKREEEEKKKKEIAKIAVTSLPAGTAWGDEESPSLPMTGLDPKVKMTFDPFANLGREPEEGEEEEEEEPDPLARPLSPKAKDKPKGLLGKAKEMFSPTKLEPAKPEPEPPKDAGAEIL